jgi:hypothetical protein
MQAAKSHGLPVRPATTNEYQCAAATAAAPAAAAGGFSMAVMWLFTAFCTFSKARTSI